MFNEFFSIDSDDETDEIDEMHSHSHSHKYYPIPFLLALFGYSLILMIEKIIFDSHSHTMDEEEDERINNERNIINVNTNNNARNSLYYDSQNRVGSGSICI